MTEIHTLPTLLLITTCDWLAQVTGKHLVTSFVLQHIVLLSCSSQPGQHSHIQASCSWQVCREDITHVNVLLTHSFTHICMCTYTCAYTLTHAHTYIVHMHENISEQLPSCEQPSSPDVNQSLITQDVFQPIPGLISCAGVTGSVGVHAHTHAHTHTHTHTNIMTSREVYIDAQKAQDVFDFHQWRICMYINAH